MIKASDALIERLRERLRRSPAIAMDAHMVRSDEAGEIVPPPRPRPPVPPGEVEAVERALGFALPPLVRRLYAEVANGGYGPAYGINRLRPPAGIDLELESFLQDVGIEGWHILYHTDRPGEEPPSYFQYRPEPSIRFCEDGCNISLWVDCSTPDGPVFMDDPNRSFDDRECIIPVAGSVAAWLTTWLDEEPWPEERYR